MLPIFSQTMELMKDSFGELTNVIHVAPNRHVSEYISKSISVWPVPVLLIPGESSFTKYNSFSVRLLSPSFSLSQEFLVCFSWKI